MVNGKCKALRECNTGIFANPGHFDTETSKSIKCNFETFRFLDFQTSETNRLFETLKKISRVRDSFVEKKKKKKLEAGNADNR